MTHVYHLLTESEPFSEYHGGAISRWVANVLRSDDDSIVLASAADNSWSFRQQRVQVVKCLLAYKKFNDIAGRMLPWRLRTQLLGVILRRAIRNIEPGDTVWVHNRPEFAAALEPFIHLHQAKLILFMHNSHLVERPEKLVRAIQADSYVFVSHYLEQQVLQKFPCIGKTKVLHGGADMTIFYPAVKIDSPIRVPVVLLAGRLVPDKGLHIFVDAMEILQKRNVQLDGVVLGGSGFGNVGPTTYLKEIQQRAPSNVSFHAYCSGSALGARFREADIFCMPACWHEPLGLVVLEAMATGLAIVATRSGGIPEMLTQGGGILVTRGSAVELADALEQVAMDSALRQRLAKEAYASFQMSFTWTVVQRNYYKILHDEASETLAAEVRLS
jgi:spore coat protein SA